ncbi:hypothetical protein LOTGIDRAFT_236467 [Lottia gigantea]|uniref:Uncharacterized protein n=1 Tax=Lottia gigantea TaxID=225164 RepID=V3YZH9_LOTGI|nr:hypothetical protein LOTGIDRAFT_236467 [Lottia gigantea]ESO83603.1 hypothetical protein LOTGIDRAFT_236467 [Lottia gigantea]
MTRFVMNLLLIQILCLASALGILDAASKYYSYKFILTADNLEGMVDEGADDNTYVHVLDPERTPSGELKASEEHIFIEISTTAYRKEYFDRLGLDIENDKIDYTPEFRSMNSSAKNSLPKDIKIEIIHTTAFKVFPDFSLRLSEDLDELRKKTVIQFYVLLANVTSAEIVSNPLPFMVFVKQRPVSLEEHGAAIYAGIIVLIIVAIALLVPFTVRAKRRRRAGKPICGFGSAKSPEDIQKEKLAGKDNAAMIFDDGKNFSRRSSTIEPGHESFQQHMVRSVSDFHFQPKWLDPHYSDAHLPPQSHHHHHHHNNNMTNGQLHPNGKRTEERL